MRFLISFPVNYQSEFEWLCNVLFSEYLGVDYVTASTNGGAITIELDGRKIEFSNTFFANAENKWLLPESLPQMPLAFWDLEKTELNVPLIESPLPILFGKPELNVSKKLIKMGLDIFGTVFFMLSRYEEAVLPDRDRHDRFPSTASIAYRASFLDRPIVDECIEILKAGMKHLWPSLEFKQNKPRTLVSCDVDTPYVCDMSKLKGVITRVGGDLYIRRSIRLARQTLNNSWKIRRSDYSSDPYLQAIDWMMDVNEKVGNRVAFYFITDHSHPSLDGCYTMDEPVVRDLVRRIAQRGHEVGLHASYNTYRNPKQTKREADILRQVMKEEDIQQNEIGGRQHFLRWESPKTGRNWEFADLNYDSTLSFADRPGFRCGTCHEYTMYDPIERRTINLKQRPLVLMECSVIAEAYMGMGYSDSALKLMKSYKQTCHKFGGDFTLLWHNSSLLTDNDKKFYLELI